MSRSNIWQIRGGPIAAPGPPSRATFTALVEFLPFAAVIFRVDRRSPIDPYLDRSFGRTAAAGTAEVGGMSGRLGPVGWGQVKSFHANKGQDLSIILEFLGFQQGGDRLRDSAPG